MRTISQARTKMSRFVTECLRPDFALEPWQTRAVGRILTFQRVPPVITGTAPVSTDWGKPIKQPRVAIV